MRQETERLLGLLDALEVHPAILQEGLGDFSADSRNELVAHLASAPDLSASARLLSRLLFIRTPENEADLRTVFLRYLQSPLPEARKASLYGLDALGDPAMPFLAESALDDPDDRVVAAACDLLLRKASPDPRWRELLERVHAAHKGDEGFRSTLGLLESQGIGHP
jgi:hypothetical protein